MALFCRVAVMILINIAAFNPAVFAQTQASQSYVTIQGQLTLLTHHNGNITPASWYAPSYSYEMVYDPACRTQFTFTECKKNGKLLKLLSWNYNRLVHAPPELMSLNSRTENVLVRTGDTISFYRELEWYNPQTNRMDTSNYYALDTLDMAVYLVRTIDGKPFLLDSIGILPRTNPGMPTIYGNRPIMALVSYVVPPALNGDSVFVGITIRARGSGPYYFTRMDGVTVGMSERLKNARYHEYLSSFGLVYAKRTLIELTQATGSHDAVLRVSRTAGSPNNIHIVFSGPLDGGCTAVAIYDESGNLVFYPYTSRTDGKQSETMYKAPASGVYFVTLTHNGQIVKTNKIVIAQ